MVVCFPVLNNTIKTVPSCQILNLKDFLVESNINLNRRGTTCNNHVKVFIF